MYIFREVLQKMNEGERKHSNKGFTMVELIVVIAIIAILAAAITPNIINYIEEAREQMDVHNACLIRDALRPHAFPSDYQGTRVQYVDPDTGLVADDDDWQRGWVYVDHNEIRCSDPSTAIALIDAGLVRVSAYSEAEIRRCDVDPTRTRYFPQPGDGDYIRKHNNEYVFKNSLTCKARKNWNTYQIDVYLPKGGGEPVMGATASNQERTTTHTKDEETARLFAEKLGYEDARITPVGQTYSGN